MTVGKSAHELYLKISGHYPINGICLLVEDSADEPIKETIEKIRSDCQLRNILFDIFDYPKNDFKSLIEILLKISKKYPDDQFKLFINISSGRRDAAVMAFIAGMWINCTGYYLATDMKEKIEFPTPKVALSKLERNGLYRRILEVLNENKDDYFSQSQLIDKIVINPNNNTKISAQVMSQSIERLEKYGLVEKEPKESREDKIKITLAGFIADLMIKE